MLTAVQVKIHNNMVGLHPKIRYLKIRELKICLPENRMTFSLEL